MATSGSSDVHENELALKDNWNAKQNNHQPIWRPAVASGSSGGHENGLALNDSWNPKQNRLRENLPNEE